MASEEDMGAELAFPADHILYRGGRLHDLAFCHLDVSDDTSVAIVNMILVTVVEGRYLVAVPHGAWARAVARRVLPRDALSRAINVAVPGMLEDGVAESGSTVKVWVGYLQAELVPVLLPSTSDDPSAITFLDESGSFCGPAGQSLMELSNDQFAFLSAVSQAEGPAEPGPEAVQERVKALETGMAELPDAVSELPAQLKASLQPTASPATPRKSALRKPHVSFPHLDPSVVASARASGVPDEHLQKLSDLYSRKPPQMTDLPKKSKSAVLNVLSESEDEELEEAIAGAAASGDDGTPGSPVERAVLQLTKLVSNMSKRERKSGGIEGILDRSDASGGEGASSSSAGSRTIRNLRQPSQRNLNGYTIS